MRQAILCASAGGLFVTLTLMAYREVYVQNQARYQAIFEIAAPKAGGYRRAFNLTRTGLA
jgi:hypothetical protein